jgi:DNA topoisomerase-1
LENRLDDIANSASNWNDVVGDFYEKFKPGVDKLNSKELISKCKDERKRMIGKNVEGIPLYAYIAKYGPVIQIGDGKDCKYVKIDPKYSVNTITYDDYLIMTKFPKKLGIYNGNDIFIKNGPYGYYLSYNEKNYKLLEGYDENLCLEDGIKCINNNSSSEGTGKSTLIKVIDNYTIKNGPYGYYIQYNKKFFNIPKEYIIEKLTKEECDTIIKIPKKSYKKK